MRGYWAGFDNIDQVHMTALQFMLNGDVRESELVGYLTERGFDVPPNYLDVIIKRTGIVERTHDGHGRIKPSYLSSVSSQLPQFKLGKSSELDLRKQVEGLKRENEELKSSESAPVGLSDQQKKEDLIASWRFMLHEINPGKDQYFSESLNARLVAHPIFLTLKRYLSTETLKAADEHSSASWNSRAFRLIQDDIDRVERQWNLIPVPIRHDVIEKANDRSVSQELKQLKAEQQAYIDELQRMRSASNQQVAQIEELESQAKIDKHTIAELRSDIEERNSALRKLRHQLGSLQICLAGLKKGEPLNQQILIRLVHPNDKKLADDIRTLFLSCGVYNSPWKVVIDPDLKLRDNPTKDSRIVITACEDGLSSTLKAALNTYDLLPEQVTAAAPQSDEKGNDVTITIYMEPKS